MRWRGGGEGARAWGKVTSTDLKKHTFMYSERSLRSYLFSSAQSRSQPGSTRVPLGFYRMAATSAPAASSSSMAVAAGSGVTNFRTAGSGVANPTLIHALPPAHWHKDKRFKRLGEGSGGVVAQGGFGDVFQGFDELRQEIVCIKRQRKNTAAAGKEVACYSMLEAFPHPNIIRMYGMWTANFRDKGLSLCSDGGLQDMSLEVHWGWQPAF